MRSAIFVRSAIGLAQGLVLFALFRAASDIVWPATVPVLFAPLVTVALAVPVVVLAGLAELRLRTLLAWAIVAGLICAGVAAYGQLAYPIGADDGSRLVLRWDRGFGLAAVLFVLHALVMAGDADRRLVASYPRYFEAAWRLAIQLAVAALFTAVFWGLLWLGVELFRLVRIELLARLVKNDWFWIPVTSTVLALALHVVTLRAALATGIRTLGLGLLAWLLPIMTLLVTAFLLVLPFTGLEPLWNTRRGTASLLAAAVALLVLINAAYQDGTPETRPVVVLRIAQAIAAIALGPLVALAAYGLFLRVDQHGWTPDRVVAAAATLTLGCQAIGYLVAAVMAPRTLRPIETVNVFAAGGVVVVLLSLMSPLADPVRIAVDNQVARLRAGRIAPERFDYTFLRFEAGRRGIEALTRLAADPPGPQPTVVAERAGRALRVPSRSAALALRLAPPPAKIAAVITVVSPKDVRLPEDFAGTDWTTVQDAWRLPPCLRVKDTRCNAVLADLDGDGRDEILLFGSDGAAAFERQAGGWRLLGTIDMSGCRDVRPAIAAGAVELVAPRRREIAVAGRRLQVVPIGCE